MSKLLQRLFHLVLVCTLAADVLAASQGPAAAPFPVQQVAPGTWFVQGESALGSSANQNFISNAAFVVGKQSVLVVDALGSPHLAERLVATIRSITTKPIAYVLVTHYHADHIYGLQVFTDLGAKVVGQRRAIEYLQSDTARLRLQASREELFPWIDEHTRLIAPQLWVDDELRLDLGGTEVLLRHAGPAHTPEDLVAFVPQTGVLFAGDLVFRARIPFVGQADSGAWVAALDQVLAFKPRLLVPGHGPVSNAPIDDLALTRDYLAHLRLAMGEAARNLEPFEEAYAKADWSRFERLPLFRVANRINAYNTYLLMEREPAPKAKP